MCWMAQKGGGQDLTSNPKAWTLTASYNGACAWNTIERSQRNMVAEPINTDVKGNARTIKAGYYKQGMANFITNGGHCAKAVAEPVNTTADGKAQCLRATCYKDGVRNIAGNDIDRKTGVAERIEDE